MNLDSLSTWIDIIGAIGVVASLIYLAIQIRHNTRAMMAQSAREAVAAMRDFNQAMINDPEISRIFRVGAENLTNLTEAERGRFGHILFNFFKTAEELHYQYLKGTLDPEIWESWKGIVSLYATSPGFTEYWKMREMFFTTAFRAEHDSWSAPGAASTDQFAKGVKR